MTQFRRLIVAIALTSTSTWSPAQKAKPAPKASQAARAFTLDLGAVPEDAGVTSAAADTSTADTGPRTSAPLVSGASIAPFNLDTPIERLLADPRAKAVLDKDVPGLSDDENLPRFRTLSLRRFQPLTGGQMTDALLAQVDRDLAGIGPAPKGKGRNAGR